LSLQPYFALVSNARPQAKLPVRADAGSAGYDFYLCEDVVLHPGDVVPTFTDIKAYMPSGMVLLLTIRSSLAKKGIIIPNAPGIIDPSYFDNPSNEGNIGILLLNTGQSTRRLYTGDRIAQGIFVTYHTAVHDQVAAPERTGGFGSSGTN